MVWGTMIEIEKKNIKMIGQLRDLLGSEIVRLDYLIKNKDNFNFPAVYIISKPHSKKVIYAGRTKTKYLWERIKHHKTINKNSDLNIMIKGRKGYPKKVGEYEVRYLKVKEKRKRMFFENFIIGILQPELNKEG